MNIYEHVFHVFEIGMARCCLTQLAPFEHNKTDALRAGLIQHCLICVLYRPPSANDSYFNDILDMIEKATVNGQDCILLGDLSYDNDINKSLHKNPIQYL